MIIGTTIGRRPGSSATPVVLTATWASGFTTNVSWDQSGSFILQRAFRSNYSDSVNIYSGAGNSYQDLTSVLSGNCYYRISLNGGNWVNTTSTSTISDGTTGTVTCFSGDSVTYGNNATNPTTEGYARIFYTQHGWTAPTGNELIGLSGYCITQNVTPHWDYTSGGANPMQFKTAARNFLVLAWGANDTNNTTSSAYQSALETCIDYAINTAGWPANRIVILGPFVAAENTSICQAFSVVANAAATLKGCPFLSVTDFEVSVNIIPGGFHPNTAQHAIISQWLGNHLGNVS